MQEELRLGGTAVVVFSGGQDSTTCLGWAMRRFEKVVAVSFSYGQRHSVELECAANILAKHNIEQVVIDIPALRQFGDSALTGKGDTEADHSHVDGVHASFVPVRNVLFLSMAYGYAQKIGADAIITGVCQQDHNLYPDCRDEFIHKLSRTLEVGYRGNINILTPLMFLTKAQTWALAEEEGVFEDVRIMSHTCYNGDRETLNKWGYGCGHCGACLERSKGYEEFVG
jgi:7-cyano-7-deazaguanine synthase